MGKPVTKHTPGPWKVVPNRHTSLNTTIGNGDYGAIAECSSMRPHPKENEANARLIAKAPELLEALLEVQKAIACFRDDEPYTYRGQVLNMEEVKYVIVDTALEGLES